MKKPVKEETGEPHQQNYGTSEKDSAQEISKHLITDTQLGAHDRSCIAMKAINIMRLSQKNNDFERPL